jgi:hypothetical protein
LMGLCMLGVRTEMHIEFMKCLLRLSSFKHTVNLQVAGSMKILPAIFELGYIWLNVLMDWVF